MGGQPMVSGTVTDALQGGMPTVPSQGMSPHDVELSQYDQTTTAADSATTPSMQLRFAKLCIALFPIPW